MIEDQLAFYSRRIREVKCVRKQAKKIGDSEAVTRYTADIANYVKMRKEYKDRKHR